MCNINWATPISYICLSIVLAEQMCKMSFYVLYCQSSFAIVSSSILHKATQCIVTQVNHTGIWLEALQFQNWMDIASRACTLIMLKMKFLHINSGTINWTYWKQQLLKRIFSMKDFFFANSDIFTNQYTEHANFLGKWNFGSVFCFASVYIHSHHFAEHGSGFPKTNFHS